MLINVKKNVKKNVITAKWNPIMAEYFPVFFCVFLSGWARNGMDFDGSEAARVVTGSRGRQVAGGVESGRSVRGRAEQRVDLNDVHGRQTSRPLDAAEDLCTFAQCQTTAN